ncbi:MAG: alpha/beta hydrolase [SAR324 cluster bacterium]
MPSWQSRAVTAVLKLGRKRRPEFRDVERTRAGIRRMEPLLAFRRGVQVSAARDAPVAAEWVVPAGAAPRRTLVYLHGGAYLFCSPRTHRGITAFLARAIPARVLVPAYRLAPEHPFPAALDDTLACLRWLARCGVAARDLVLAGDSAGGGLALAATIALRDAGEALPARAALLAPWVDLAATGASIRQNSESDAWVYGDLVALGATLYLGKTAASHPLASPLYADLTGLPPLLLHVSDSEVLFDDSRRLAQRAQAAGVSVTLKVWPGLPHVWQGFVPFIPEAGMSLREIAAFLAAPLEG